ncbi:MAG: NAD(P)H-dependent oxidoreductase [Propionibacteriaceae bacterium]|jgi:NAD(P)H dehydrogenase (quinone)|nr:NAD(P)H-dependent oxidoreductase [Propionibacteriaceae bacterium]
MSLVHIVYAHPNPVSFTHALLDAFVAGLDDAGHQHSISDLYAMGFNPVMSPAEYARESRCDAALPVAGDVAQEQAALDAADVWVFVYPVWWSDCPAILKGWFDRVWTVGWAYHEPTATPTRKALVLCSAGQSVEHLRDTGLGQAMRAVMVSDRIFTRADVADMQVFAGSEGADPAQWELIRQQHLDQARHLGQTIDLA